MTWGNWPNASMPTPRTADLALLSPDETTIAMLDNGLRTRFTVLSTDSATAGGRST